VDDPKAPPPDLSQVSRNLVTVSTRAAQGRLDTPQNAAPEVLRARDMGVAGICAFLIDEDADNFAIRLDGIESMIREDFTAPRDQFLAKAISYRNADESVIEGTLAEVAGQETRDTLARLRHDVPDQMTQLHERLKDAGVPPGTPGQNPIRVKQGATSVVHDRAIGTNKLATCYGIGKTGQFGGHVYSALCHWDGSFPDDDVVVVLDQLEGLINGLTGSDQLVRPRWLVVGGRRDSEPEQRALLAAIQQRQGELTIKVITADQSNARSALSSAMIGANGSFWYDIVEGEP
jgi:hypothetical protein